MSNQEYPPAPPHEEERNDGEQRKREILNIMRDEAIDETGASEASREFLYIRPTA